MIAALIAIVAIIPFMTAVYINALIGSIFTKFMPSPIVVDAAITK
jgi:hypothetical protein